MLKGKTKSGFKFEIEESRLKNYDLVETLAEVDANPLVFPRVVTLLLGKNAAEALKNHLRDEDGCVSVELMMDEIQEIFESQQKIKNS